MPATSSQPGDEQACCPRRCTRRLLPCEKLCLEARLHVLEVAGTHDALCIAHNRLMPARRTEEWAAIEAAVEAALDALDAITEDAGVAIRESVPEYAYVGDEQLRNASRRNLHSLLAALGERRPLNDEELQ